jgi:DNA-binding NarL/FixJ family response regulator
MHKIIIGDSQAMYRAGLARLLSMEDEFHIVAECADCLRLYRAVETFRDAIVIVASTLKPHFPLLMGMSDAARSRVIVVAENIEHYLQYTSQGVSGVIFRGTNPAVFVDCVRRVATGNTSVPPVEVQLTPDQEDLMGSEVQARLTPKELTILSLIVQGMKNKEIATRLKISEQSVKNYLRVIFVKTGVSDRLQLALFTVHHRVLASAAAEAGAAMEMRMLRSSSRVSSISESAAI